MLDRLDRRFLNVSLTVLSVANAPADNPTAGVQYIVGTNPSGDFASAQTNSIARYDGSKWRFSAPDAGGLEVLNANTGEILSFNGSAWVVVASLYRPIIPVLGIVPTGTALPSSASVGDTFLKTNDSKIYTATAANTWGSWTTMAEGNRYASSSDHKIYISDGRNFTVVSILNGDMFLNKADNAVYVYDEDASAFVRVGSSSGSSVEFATETHTLTANEVTAKSFSLTHSVASGEESNVQLFISGIAQAAGVDFTASGNSISWSDKGLDELGLEEGDSFIVHYIKA